MHTLQWLSTDMSIKCRMSVNRVLSEYQFSFDQGLIDWHSTTDAFTHDPNIAMNVDINFTPSALWCNLSTNFQSRRVYGSQVFAMLLMGITEVSELFMSSISYGPRSDSAVTWDEWKDNTYRKTLALQVGGWAWSYLSHPVKYWGVPTNYRN